MMTLILKNGTELCDGALISFGDDPSCYILHYGKYNMTKGTSGKISIGWYAKSIGSGIAIPITDSLLDMCKVFNNGFDVTVDQRPASCCSNICISEDNTESFTQMDKYLLDRSWITVDTIAERNALPKTILLTGRIVEVNNAEEGESSYYRWNFNKQMWDSIVFVHSDVAADLTELKKTLDVIHVILFGTNVDTTTPDELDSTVEYPESVPSTPVHVDSLIKDIRELQSAVSDWKLVLDNLVEDVNTLEAKVSQYHGSSTTDPGTEPIRPKPEGPPEDNEDGDKSDEEEGGEDSELGYQTQYPEDTVRDDYT